MNSPRLGKKVPPTVRLPVLFCFASFVFGPIAYLLVSNLQAWSFGHCGNNSTALCAVSGLLLGYWWVTLVPGIVALMYVGSRVWR